MKEESVESGKISKVPSPSGGINRGVSILDLILRIIAVVGTLGSAAAMGTTGQTLPFFTQFLRFNAQYDDFPSFSLFVIVNSIVCAYVALSIPLSIYHIIRSKAKGTRIFLIIFDTVMLGLLTAAASAAAAIVYLAHKGNSSANWLSVCQQFNDFCQRISGSLIGSFAAVLVFALLIFLSAVALSRRSK